MKFRIHHEHYSEIVELASLRSAKLYVAHTYGIGNAHIDDQHGITYTYTNGRWDINSVLSYTSDKF